MYFHPSVQWKNEIYIIMWFSYKSAQWTVSATIHVIFNSEMQGAAHEYRFKLKMSTDYTSFYKFDERTCRQPKPFGIPNHFTDLYSTKLTHPLYSSPPRIPSFSISRAGPRWPRNNINKRSIKTFKLLLLWFCGTFWVWRYPKLKE